MSWREVSPGRFERPFDTIEQFYKLISAGAAALGREHWTVNIVAQLKLDPSLGHPEPCLRSAWKATRFKLPQIAAFAVENTYVYEVPDALALQSWLDETFVVEPLTATTADLYANGKPSPMAKMHYLPQTSEILIRSSHYRVDGIGALHLLDTFLKSLAVPVDVHFGSEPTRLSPSLDQILSIPASVCAESEATANDQIKLYIDNLPSIGLDPDLSSLLPGGTRRCEIELSSDLTLSIISQCKQEGFSVTAGVHAAVIKATQHAANPSSSATKWTTWISFDFRKYCPPPYNGADHGVSIYHTGFPATLTPTTFFADALKIQEYNSRNLTAPDDNVFSYLNCYVDKVRTLFTTPVPEGTPPPTEPLLGSLGVIDKQLTSWYDGRVEVTDFWLGVEQLSPQLQIYVWTRAGRMKLSICYNESFYSADFVVGFLRAVKVELLQGLQISQELRGC